MILSSHSHSLKATTLSWAATCEMPHHRILGRHSSSVKESGSVSSRELSYAPVCAMERMFKLIRLSEFHPDATRSKFFQHDLEPGAVPVFPPTQTFQGSGVAPVTPTMQPAQVIVEQPVTKASLDPACETKSEREQLEPKAEPNQEADNCFEISSSSERMIPPVLRR